MYRTLVILRHTFQESVVQPIYSLLIALAAAIIAIFTLLPFFTLGEDTVMFKSVALDVILLLVLISTLFATSRSIFEEIEDRTMLTLMSKPVARWQVLVGKYAGIVLAALLAIAILGGILALCTWWRIPADYQLRLNSIDEREVQQVIDYRRMHLAGLYPNLLHIWLQIAVLAAVGVALSTRVSLVVNLPVVILVYLAGNMTRFLFPLDGPPLGDRSVVVKGIAWLVSLVLPYLETFDDRQRTVYSRIALKGTEFAMDVRAVPLAEIWSYAGFATLYALAYVVFALSIGMCLFQTRELGGGEG